MNIFFVDRDPIRAAESLCNKHVVKMINESAQLLCSAHHIKGTWLGLNKPEYFFKLTHRNHPCSIWVRSISGNYKWLTQHLIGLLNEYTYRYNKTHKVTSMAYWLYNHYPCIPLGDMFEPPQCMPDFCKVVGDSELAYRNCYNLHKRITIDCRWVKREPPEWWTQIIQS